MQLGAEELQNALAKAGKLEYLHYRTLPQAERA